MHGFAVSFEKVASHIYLRFEILGSYYFDTRKPESDAVKFDEFKLKNS